MKKKHLNTIKIASLTLMLGCFAVGGVYNHYQEKQHDNVVKVERKVQPKYASYNDDNYTITLSANEINNYSWDHLFGSYDGDALSLKYNNDVYTYSTDEDGFFYWEYTSSIYIAYANSEENTENFDEYKFYYYDTEEFLPFEYDVEITTNSEIYELLKYDIELDIQANQPVSMGDSIVGAITSGLGLIPDLANEFLTGFSALFWNSQTSSLTTFSYFALVFLGIAITMAVVKLVLAIIRGNTGA